MDVSINLTSEQILHDNRRRRILLRVLTVLAALTVFCTVYALVLPAITEEAEVFCGFEEHAHAEACYAQTQLICGEEAYEAHTHTEDCLAEVTELTCALEETEGHTHTEACFEEQPVLSCGLEETEGGEARMVLTCTETESEAHSHGADCYAERQVLNCSEEHSHETACYTTERYLACGLEETAGHTHTDACYTEETAAEAHTHSDSCYTLQQVLICTQEECEAHTHTDACYTTSLQPACGLEEGEGHAHTEACYAPAEGEPALICELEEHSHSLQCYSNPEADVETAAVWSRSVASVQLTGDWRKDLVSIAGTQMGYAESSRNYLVENGDIFGYTRYGDWYGYPYGDWCAMFVSFCLNYSDIPATAFPRDCGTRPWVEKLTAADMYVPAEGYVPTAGDLVFFDYDKDMLSDHVGIVSAVKTAEDGSFTGIATIEGNAGDRVASMNYTAGDKTLLGYGILPENPALAAEEETEDAAPELELITKTATAGDYLVTASYSAEAGLPKEAVFEAYVIDPESETFAARAAEYYETTGKTMEFLLNIGFYVNGVEVEPTGTVNITIRFLGEEDHTGVDPAIVHFGESVTESLENTPVDENAETVFAMDSFTEIGGTLSDGGDTPTAVSNVVASGTDAGGAITWTLTDDGVLTISGSGAMTNYGAAVSKYPWYSYKAQIASLVVEDGITNIAMYAFSGYTNLQTVTLGKDVAAIGAYAFQQCTALTACNLSEGLQTIGNDAFYYCTALSRLTIPETVKSIGTDAFGSCTKLTEVSIPDSVTSLGSYAFDGCSGLKSVKLGSGMTAIQPYTFRNCSALTTINLPASIAEIGSDAFEGCKALTTIALPEGFTKIGSYAFRNCSNLATLTVPTTLSAIGSQAFNGANPKVYISDLEAWLQIEFGDVSANPASGSKSHLYLNGELLTELVIPEGITKVKAYAFDENTDLTSVCFPEGLTEIGARAFYGCSNLTSVAVPASVTTIGKSAFGSVYLPEVHISDLGAWLQIDFGDSGANPASWYNSHLYVNGELLTELVVPEGTTKVKAYSFYNNRDLTSVSLPKGLTEIGAGAFYGCLFSEIALPESLLTIGSGAFQECTKIKQLNLPDGLESIGSSAFKSCTSLTELIVPAGIKSLESSVLASCTSLRQVTLPEGLTKIKSYAFENCTALKQISLPEGLKTVESAAFRGCTSLETLVVPDSVTSFAYDSCKNDTALTQLTLGAGISSIGSGIVDGNGIQTLTLRCAQLNSVSVSTAGTGKTVILDDTVNSVAAAAWTGLEKAGYRNVRFNGPNVLSLPAMSFENGGQIGGGTYYATEEGVLYLLDAQKGTASLAYVPDGLTEYTVPAAITAEGRAYTVTGVESFALFGADDLTALTITNPEQFLSVTQGAFAGAEQLKSINGCTTPDAVRALFTNENAVIGSNLTDGTKIGGAEAVLTEENRTTGTVTNTYKFSGDDEIRVNLAQLSGDSIIPPKDVTEDGVFEYYTGYSDTLDVTISNTANMTEETGTVIRTYIAFDAPDGALSLTEGAHTVTSPDGSTEFPYTVVKVNAYLYYIEVKAEKTNHSTLDINFALTYPNGSAGGNAKVWTAIGNADALTENPADGATQYQQSRWVTEKIPYYIDKTLSTAKLEFTAREDGSLTVKQFTYTITPKTESTRGSSYGMDVVTAISYTDVLTLSDGLDWSPEYLEAIKAGRWYVSSDKTGTPRSVYVYQADDTPVKLFTLSDQTMDGLTRMGPQLEVVTGEDGKETVQITWEDINGYAYSKDAAKRILTTKGRTYTLYVYDGAILVTDELTEALADKTYTVTNSVSTEWQYRYSDAVHSEDTEEASLKLSKYNLTFKKRESIGHYFGNKAEYSIYLENTGNLPYPYGDNISDTLSTSLYISPANMYKMLTDENWGSGLQITITNANFETAAFTPRQVTLVDGTSATTLTEPQNSGYNTAYGSGSETDWSAEGDGVLFVSENSAYYSTGKLQLYWQDDILYLQKGEGTPAVVADAADLQAQLNAMGFFVGASTQYRVVWTPRAEVEDTAFVIPGNTKYTFKIYATCKDTFMLLSQDHLNENGINSGYVSVTNWAYFYNTKTTTKWYVQVCNASGYATTDKFYKEFYIQKAVTNAEGESTESVIDGDVIRYTVNVTNKGGNTYNESYSYDLLPWTDCMYGAQLLLVPVAGNRALAESPAVLYTAADGTQYYKLQPAEGETEVTFRNVTVGGKIADTVMVARTAGGYTTLIKWYFSGKMPASTTMSYKALVDSAIAGDYDESTGYSVSNVTWLGDHQGHRIFDPVLIHGHDMYHDKSIVTGTDANGEDVLEKHSVIYEGDAVTYRLDIRNLGEDVYTVSSGSVYDVLPLSLKGADWSYLWSRDNVSLRYGGNYENAEQSVISGGDSWYITEGESAGSNGAWQQELRWGEDFLVQIPGGDSTFYIYVTLKYPVNSGTADYWSRYCEMNAGQDIINSFHIAGMEDTVSHELGEAPEVLLQKGVVSTSLVTENPDAEEVATALYYYENGGAVLSSDLTGSDHAPPAKPVTYYTAIYNDGDARLYLETIEDILPEGFVCDGGGKINNYYVYGTYIRSEGIVDIASATGKQVNYLTSKQASITPSYSTDYNGSQQLHLFFKLTLDQDHYSAENKHYYLLPGEAVVFIYTVYVSRAVNTDDVATNRIAMSYYNYYNLPIRISDATITGTGFGADSKNSTVKGAYTPNDGGCEVLTSEQVMAQGYTTKATNPQWLESQVSLTRKKIIPGIVKTAYSATSQFGITTMNPRVIQGGDTVTWSISLLNDGEAAITDYTFTDTIPAGNRFTGEVKLLLPDGNGGYTETLLFNILSWSEDGKTAEVSYSYAYTTSTNVSYPTTKLTLGNEQKAYIRDAYINGVRLAAYTMKLVTNDDGSMTLSIRTDKASIDVGGEAIFHVSTVQTGDVRYGVIENTAAFIPTQSFDPMDVVHDDGADDRDDTVTWSDNVWLLSAHMTYPEIQVTETADSTNYGIGSSAKNHIVLPERDSSFYYTLTVNNSTDYSMEKLILINNLPEVDDGDTYNADSKRDSAFKVVLDPARTGFTVKVKDGDGNVTVLDPGVYTIEFSTLTNFPASAADWTGGNAQNWTAQADWAAYAAANGLTYDDIRSIRVIITDPDTANLTVIPKNSVITVDFYALVDDPYGMEEDTGYRARGVENRSTDGNYKVKDGTIAWDTFGYRYWLDGQELFAGSRKVGVEIPSIPIVIKNIRTPGGNPVVLQEEQSFKILIYSGASIDSLAFDWNDLETTLAGRSFTVATLTVPAGESSSGAFRLDAAKAWKAKGAKLSETNDAFTWQTDGIYTAVEIMETQYEGVYTSLWEGGGSDLSFRNANGVTITCVNQVHGYALPETGGNGTHRYTLGGVLMLGTAAAALFGTRRRHRKEESY